MILSSKETEKLWRQQNQLSGKLEFDIDHVGKGFLLILIGFISKSAEHNEGRRGTDSHNHLSDYSEQLKSGPIIAFANKVKHKHGKKWPELGQ